MTQSSAEEIFDIYVIGGGINGAGIAADAAGRGLKVGLCEQGDLAGATSSASSKLIHGGLRYLEHYEFRLVREALAEREVLLRMVPHIARPMRFCLPHRQHLRPAWMIRLGLFLYDHLSLRKSLQPSSSVHFGNDSPLHPVFRKGFEYSDAWVDDARLVVLNALELQRRNGEVRTRTRAVNAAREDSVWRLSLFDEITGEESVVYSRALVNATGPWVKSFFESGLKRESPRGVRLIKGSHVVVPRIHSEERAYILQNEDNRIVFVIPWLEDYSMIGTTDVEYPGNPSETACSEEEKKYLCDVVNEYFKQQISPEDIVWSFAGVRPLCEDESESAQAVTRDYTIEIENEQGQAPLLSVFGGKLTTYRKLGEAAVNRLAEYFPNAGAAWTRDNVLPGGEGFSASEGFVAQLRKTYHWLPEKLVRRFSQNYGGFAFRLLDTAGSMEDMGEHFGGGLYAIEVDYLICKEWAYSVEDLLWRRSKLGLSIDAEGVRKLERYLARALPVLVPHRFSQPEPPLDKVV
ncbi:MAG: glycerol-3-phosphate dehydrogenase [Endozoicomonas sp.]